MWHRHHSTAPCRKRGALTRTAPVSAPRFRIFSRWNRGFQPFHRPSVHSVQTKRTRDTGATPPPNGEQNETKGTVHLKIGAKPCPRPRGIVTKTNECAIFFSCSFTAYFCCRQPSLTPREGPRKPPRASPFRNIAKSEKRGYSRHFRPEMQNHRTSSTQSSDVLP